MEDGEASALAGEASFAGDANYELSKVASTISHTSHIYYRTASRVVRAAPEGITGLQATPGGALDHWSVALWAAWGVRLLGLGRGRCGCGFALLSPVQGYPLFEHGPVDQLDIATRRKILRFLGEAPGGDDKSTRGAFHGHGAEELADNRNAYLERAPVFALHQMLFTVLAQDQIHPAVRAVAAGFGDAVALA